MTKKQIESIDVLLKKSNAFNFLSLVEIQDFAILLNVKIIATKRGTLMINGKEIRIDKVLSTNKKTKGLWEASFWLCFLRSIGLISLKYGEMLVDFDASCLFYCKKEWESFQRT